MAELIFAAELIYWIVPSESPETIGSLGAFGSMKCVNQKHIKTHQENIEDKASDAS